MNESHKPPALVNDAHATIAVGMLTSELAKKAHLPREEFPEPDALMQLWIECVEATRHTALADFEPTGRVTIEDADGPGAYLRVLAENGLTLAHSEVYTGHRPMHDVARTLIETLRSPQIKDNRKRIAQTDDEKVAPSEPGD